LQATQGVVDRQLNSACGKPFFACLTEIGADFDKERDLVASARMRGQPFTDNGFSLAARIARCPGRVSIGGIDGGQAPFQQGIQQAKTLLLINGSAKHVAAKNQRWYL